MGLGGVWFFHWIGLLCIGVDGDCLGGNCIFVCYAEDPATMSQNHPEEYQNLVNAKPEWGDVYRTYGNMGGNPNPVGPSMVIPPAQQVVVTQTPQSQAYAAAPIMNVQPQQDGANTQCLSNSIRLLLLSLCSTLIIFVCSLHFFCLVLTNLKKK